MQHDNTFTGEHILHLQREIEEKQQQLVDSDSLLRRKQAELAALRDEVRDLMVGNNAMQAHINMLQGLLEQISEEVISADELTTAMAAEVKAAPKFKRNPMDMVKPQFKGIQLGDIVELILKQNRKPLTTSELSRMIYDTNDKDEFARARNSLSAELRSGASKEPPRWLKRGRSTYVARSQAIAGKVLPSSNSKGGDARAS